MEKYHQLAKGLALGVGSVAALLAAAIVLFGGVIAFDAAFVLSLTDAKAVGLFILAALIAYVGAAFIPTRRRRDR
jgi:hypothetical protein